MAGRSDVVASMGIEVLVTSPGINQTVNKVSNGLTRVENRIKKTSTSFDANRKSSRKLTQAFLELSRGAEDFAVVFATTGVAGGLRASINNMSQMGAIMSPMAGIIVGMAGALTALLLPAFKSTRKELDFTNNSLKEFLRLMDLKAKVEKRSGEITKIRKLSTVEADIAKAKAEGVVLKKRGVQLVGGEGLKRGVAEEEQSRLTLLLAGAELGFVGSGKVVKQSPAALLGEQAARRDQRFRNRIENRHEELFAQRQRVALARPGGELTVGLTRETDSAIAREQARAELGKEIARDTSKAGLRRLKGIFDAAGVGKKHQENMVATTILIRDNTEAIIDNAKNLRDLEQQKRRLQVISPEVFNDGPVGAINPKSTTRARLVAQRATLTLEERLLRADIGKPTKGVAAVGKGTTGAFSAIAAAMRQATGGPGSTPEKLERLIKIQEMRRSIDEKMLIIMQKQGKIATVLNL